MKIVSLIPYGLAALVMFASPAGASAADAPAAVGAEAVKRSPYSMAGQLVFRSGGSLYQGSGTVVHARSVLTAAHNLWDPVNGWSTDITFSRAKNGATSASREKPVRSFIFGSYRSAATLSGTSSVRAFASDIGGLRFATAPAGGGFAGWRADMQAFAPGVPLLCLGYGAQTHGGDELLGVTSLAGFQTVLGAFLESRSVMFEAGMSGGPVFAEVAPGDFRVVGVIVAGSENPPAGGLRAIDAAGAGFLGTYLRY